VKGTHILGHIFAVGFCYDWVFVKDIVHELRGDSNLDFASFDRFWTWVHELAGFALLLAL
jgi:hypothetical protein